MEGGEAVLADPSLIARNYREAVRLYIAELDELVRTTGIDYHRVKMHERYDDVLVRFLLGRTPKRGAPMTFLQPALLLALPLARCRSIIHLIHLYRRRQVKWAAMMFLLAAQRMNKGLSRLRQILILALRVLAVAAIIFVRHAAARGRMARADRRRAGYGADSPRSLGEHGAAKSDDRCEQTRRRACAI